MCTKKHSKGKPEASGIYYTQGVSGNGLKRIGGWAWGTEDGNYTHFFGYSFRIVLVFKIMLMFYTINQSTVMGEEQNGI